MIKLTGKNTDFVVLFSADTQTYTIYYKGNFLLGGFYKYRQIKPYLD
jgi:hypothetical protein